MRNGRANRTKSGIDAAGCRLATILVVPSVGAMLFLNTSRRHDRKGEHARANRLDVGATQPATFYNLTVSSNCFFYVVAYNLNRVESNPSQGLFYRSPALSAGRLAAQANGILNLQFRAAPGTICSIQYTPSLLNPQWQTLGSGMADANALITIVDLLSNSTPARYYRAVR